MTRTAALGLIGALVLPVVAEDLTEDVLQAGAKFQKNCMSCHQPPDLRFESDRAWIGQIRETA